MLKHQEIPACINKTKAIDNQYPRGNTLPSISLLQTINKISLFLKIFTLNLQISVGTINKLIPSLGIYGASFGETSLIDVDFVSEV
jgi:hypothetical protein